MKKNQFSIIFFIFSILAGNAQQRIMFSGNNNEQFAGKLITLQMDASCIDTSHINSLAFTNGVRDTTFRYSKTTMGKKVPLEIGIAWEPGLYHAEVDTINNKTGFSDIVRSLYGRYSMFIHPANDQVCRCPNTDSSLFMSETKLLPFPDTVYTYLDSLFLKTLPDSLNFKLDTLAIRQTGNTTAHVCDSLKNNSMKLALIITGLGSSPSWSSITIVIDTMETKASTEANLCKKAIDIFKETILDTTALAIDTLTLTNTWKKAVRSALEANQPGFEKIYSNGFVRRLFMIKAKLDINYVCERYFLYKRSGHYNQLVLLMKVPI